MTSLHFQAAGPEDWPIRLDLMAAFNQTEAIAFDRAVYRDRLQLAAAWPDLIQVWLICQAHQAIGYAALTFPFSFEFRGRIATLDEFDIGPAQRSQGVGSWALAQLAQIAQQHGTTMLSAHISPHKPELVPFYQRAGLVPYPYQMYYKPLTLGGVEGVERSR